MKTKMKYFVVFFVVLSLLFVGAACKKKEETKPIEGTWIGGKEGLTVSFGEDFPSEVYANEDFEINVKLTNKGETPVKAKNAIASLEGIDEKAFSISSRTQPTVEDLGAMSKTPGGELMEPFSTLVSFPAKYTTELPSDTQFSLAVNVCYKYSSFAKSSLCLAKDLISAARKKSPLCKVQEEKPIEKKGAPVQVTKVSESQVARNKAMIVLQIENVGEGKVYSPAYLSQMQHCDENTDFLDRLNIEIYTDPATPISCGRLGDTNSGELKLTGGKASLTCTVDTSGLQESLFTRPLYVKMDYTYRDKADTTFTVKAAI